MISTADPKMAAHLTHQAEAHLAQGNLDKAIAIAEQAIAVDSGFAPAYRAIGKAFHQAGNLEEAMGWYTRALALQPNSAEVHANVGSLYAQQQRWQDAIACYQKAIALKPDFAGAYRNLARIWTQLKQPTDAADCWYYAFTLEPEKASPDDHITLGNALADQGHLDRAITCYRYAIQHTPTAAAYQNLAEALRHQGQLDEAAVCYRKAIELNSQPNGKNGSSDRPPTTAAAAGSTDFRAAEVDEQPAPNKALLPIPPASPLPPSVTRPAPSASSLSVSSAPKSAATAATATLSTSLLHAQALYTQGKWEEAIALCQRILTQTPSAAAYKILGNALQATGQIEDAATCYGNALKLEPSAELYANLGSLFAQQQQWQQAIAYYQQAIALNPNFAGAYRNLGRVWVQVGQTEQATECWYRALSLEPEKVAAEEHINLGNTLMNQGQIEQAIDCYRRAIDRDPTLGGAHQNLAEALTRQHQWQEATLHYRKALELNLFNPFTAEPSPDAPPNGKSSPQTPRRDAAAYMQQAAEYCANNNWDDAIAICQQAILHIQPEAAIAFKTMGDALYAKGNVEDATRAYLRATELYPQFAGAYVSLATLYSQRQQWQDAIACYQRVTELEPTSPDAYLHLAQIWQQQAAWERAIAAYRTLTTLQPNHWQVHHNLGDCLLKQQQWDEAAIAYRRAIELNPQFSWSHNNLGDALMHLEQWDEAAIALSNAAKLNPDFHWSHYNLGDVLMKLSQWEGAIAAYRNALQLDPNLPRIQQKLGDALRQRAKSDLELALSYYNEAIQRDPGDVQNYHKALDIKPDDASLYEQLADALAKQGQTDGAIVFYQMARQLQLNHADVVTKLEKISDKKKIKKPSFLTSFSHENTDYSKWVNATSPTPLTLRRMTEASEALAYKPQISIILPICDPSVKFLQEAIQSIVDQSYPYWELYILNDNSSHSHGQSILKNFEDARIKCIASPQKGSISNCINSALAATTGEFVVLFKQNDVLALDALYHVATLLNQYPQADMVYSDEDRLNQYGQRLNPFFKPDWCPDSLLSRMYTAQIGVYRRTLLNQLGGFRQGYGNHSEYDLVLRLSEQTNKIFHIPKVLYHSRLFDELDSGIDVHPDAHATAENVLADALQRRNEMGRVIPHQQFSDIYTVRYQITAYKLVSIIIPTRNLGYTLNCCLQSIFEKSTYTNYEVIVIDNGSDEAETLAIIATWKERESKRFSCHRLDIPFNYSKINNYAVSQARGDYLLFLNNDTEVVTPDWIEGMVEQAQRPSIGAVGALLLYPDNSVQHAGVLIGIASVADHSHRYCSDDSPGYYGQLCSVNNVSAVTAACLMCRRELFEAVGGFDEQMAVAFNDIDLCLKLVQQGYQNVYLPHVVLYHYESKSRGIENTLEKQRRFIQEVQLFRQRWKQFISHDPCYSPNLSRKQNDYGLRLIADVEIVEVSQLDADELWGCYVDLPNPGKQTNVGSIYIEGWVLGKQSPVIEIHLTCDRKLLRNIPVNNLPRSDIARLYPGISAAEFCGFWTEIELLEIPKTTELLLQATLQNQKQIALSKIRLKYVVGGH